MNSVTQELEQHEERRSQQVRHPVTLRLWKSGAYAVSAFDRRAGIGTLVEHDGRNSLHLVHLGPDGWEETVVTRRAVERGVAISTSRLTGDRDGNLEWVWAVTRPGLERHEQWTMPTRAKGSWLQTDRRPGTTTVYRSLGGGRYRGATTDAEGSLLWDSEWTVYGSAGVQGIYTDAHGNQVGTIDISGARPASGRTMATWDGPVSSGSIQGQTTGSSIGAKASVTHATGGETMVTYGLGGADAGRTAQVTVGPDGGSVKVTVPDGSTGGSSWYESGTQTLDNGVTYDYTVIGTKNTDGSSSFTETSTGDDGSSELSFGNTDTAGNSSVSSSIDNGDGTTTLDTRTTDANGNGTDHVTVVDGDGNTVSDDTFQVQNGQTVYTTGSGTSDSTGTTSSAGTGDTTASGGTTDPNDPTQPDQPSSPDGTGSGSSMESDDGGSDDRAPGIPAGAIGYVHGSSLAALTAGAKDGSGGGDGGGDGDGDPQERSNSWRRQLGAVVSQGGGDETGWGDGGESFTIPIADVSLVAAPASGTDDWGDLRNPHAFVGFAQQLVGAFSTAGRSANLMGAIGE